MNYKNEIVCKNSDVSDDIVELPVYGEIEEAFYLHIKHVDHHSQEEEEDSSSDSSSEAEDGKFSINLLNKSTHG